jgi:hypothetical protein
MKNGDKIGRQKKRKERKIDGRKKENGKWHRELNKNGE